MDLFTKKQAQINKMKTRSLENYPTIWSNIINQWKKPGLEDQAWLTYSANYLFKTKGIRWAIDPFTLKARLPDAEQMNIFTDLSSLSFVLLTHKHADHLDLELIHSLRDTSILWVVPLSILDNVIKCGVNPGLITIPEHLAPIRFETITITPFNGLHFHKNKVGDLLGVPAMGYLLEQGRKRWLFPGDTRTYQPELISCFGQVDVVFAHLWLGKGAALDRSAWKIDEFCQFYLDLKPERIIVTHLRELGRDANDYWDIPHAKIIQTRFKALSQETKVTFALMGQQLEL